MRNRDTGCVPNTVTMRNREPGYLTPGRQASLTYARVRLYQKWYTLEIIYKGKNFHSKF